MERRMTDDPPNPALLPSGLRDLLPPEAEIEAVSVEQIMAAFAGHGYERVKPPLLEFEAGLLTGTGAATGDQTFRLMDPETQRMVGLRADITPQVARIASTRLARVPRPLRLSYAGQCLVVRGTQMAPDRQVAQTGIELIGPDSAEADAEIVLVAADALAAIGIERASFDLTMPPLAPALLDAIGAVGPVRRKLTHALDRKDVAAVADLAGPHARLLTELLVAAGPALAAIEALRVAHLPPEAAILCARLADTVRAIQARAPGLRLTLDPIEFRGFRYHTGACVTIYAAGRPEELGRGGRYVCGDGEAATGVTLFPDALLRAAPPRPGRLRVYVPWGLDGGAVRALGHAAVAALGPGAPSDEPRRLRCTHVLHDGAAVALPE